jgi:hypothetical protein
VTSRGLNDFLGKLLTSSYINCCTDKFTISSETEGDNALSSKESLVPTIGSFKPFNASNGQPTVTSSALDISSEISKDGSEPDMPSLDVETSDRSIPSARIPLNPISPGMTELGRLNKPIAFTGNESFAFLEKPSFMEDDNDNDSPVKSTATSAASTAKPSAATAAVTAGSVLESPSKATTAPIQPASQAFAFLMAPRRPKQSTVSLDGPRSMGSIEPEAPPVPPPTLDMTQISHLLAPGHGRSGSFVRHGPTGRIFATGINDHASTASDKPTASGLKSNLKAGASTGNLLAIPGPSSSSYAVQRSRSHSTGIAEMLGPSSGSHSTGHRRSATVINSPTRGLEIRAQPTGGSIMNLGSTGTGSRMPRGPRPLSRGQSLGPADVMAYEQMSRTRTRSPSPLMVGNREVSVAVASSSRQTLDVDMGMRASTFSSGSGSGSGSGRHKRTHSSTVDVLTTSTSATTHTEQSTKTYTGPSRPAKHRRTSSHMSPSLLFELEDVAHAEVRVATKTEVHTTGATTVSPSTLNMAKAPSVSRRTPAPGSPTPKRNKENAMGSMASRLPRATTPPSSFMLGMLSVKSTTNTNTDSNTDTNTAANARTPVSKARHAKGDKSDKNDFDFAFSSPKLPLPFGFESQPRSPPTAHKAFSHDRDIDLNLDFRMDDGDTVRRPAAAAAAATLPTAVIRADIPMTPIRVRALLGVPAGPPSPGSTSTELSPMGKEMMAIVREQKLKTREREVGRDRGAKEGKTERAAKGERTERASKKRAGSTSTRLRV